MGVSTCLKRVVITYVLLLMLVPEAIADHTPTHSRWDILIVEGDIPIEELEVTEEGEVAILVMVDNSNTISITIRLDYIVPHNADFTGPAEVTVQGTSIDYFEVILSGIDIDNSTEGTGGIFEVEGTVTSRQGLPVSVPGDSDSAQVEIAIPSIKKMTLETEGPGGQIDAGERISILVTLTNQGNVQQVPFNVQLTSNCVLMKLDIHLEGLDSRYEPKEAKSREVPIVIPEENPSETCTLSVEAIIYPNDDISDKVTLNESTVVKVNGPVESELDIDVSGITDSLPAPSPLIAALALMSAARPRTMRQPRS